MNSMQKLLVATLTATMTGCSYDVQTTSGAHYLARHGAPSPHDAPATATPTAERDTLEQRLLHAAAIEPALRFPARIGLARIENGALTGIPAAEATAWKRLQDRLGEGWGELVPVSPLIAELAGGVAWTKGCRGCSGPVSAIRLAAATQHLDAVLVYELGHYARDDSNFLSVANLTILGGFLLPTERVTSETAIQAMLIDVMQGYPYGQVNVSRAEDELMTTWGSGDSRNRLRARTREDAMIALVSDVEDMMQELRWKLAEQRESPHARPDSTPSM